MISIAFHINKATATDRIRLLLPNKCFTESLAIVFEAVLHQNDENTICTC